MDALSRRDVVQLDPESELGKAWGPQFVIVEEIRSWGFLGYFIHAEKRGEFGSAYVRVKHGCYVLIGQACWATAPDEPEAIND